MAVVADVADVADVGEVVADVVFGWVTLISPFSTSVTAESGVALFSSEPQPVSAAALITKAASIIAIFFLRIIILSFHILFYYVA